MKDVRCVFGLHQWSEWEESPLNKYRWFKDKNKIRWCWRCHAEQREFDKIKNVGKIGEEEGDNNNEMRTSGRKLNVKMVKKAQKYRKKGLSYRDIAKLLDRDVKQVHRWVNYPQEELLNKC